MFQLDNIAPLCRQCCHSNVSAHQCHAEAARDIHLTQCQAYTHLYNIPVVCLRSVYSQFSVCNTRRLQVSLKPVRDIVSKVQLNQIKSNIVEIIENLCACGNDNTREIVIGSRLKYLQISISK